MNINPYFWRRRKKRQNNDWIINKNLLTVKKWQRFLFTIREGVSIDANRVFNKFLVNLLAIVQNFLSFNIQTGWNGRFVSENGVKTI